MKPLDRVERMVHYLARVPPGKEVMLPFQVLKQFFRCKAEDVAFKTVEWSQLMNLKCEKLDEHTWKFSRL